MAIPVPLRPSGFTLGEPNANIKLDVFFDIQCPHSKKYWPTLLAILKHYEGQPLSVTAHLITISNHHQAWTMSLAMMAVAGSDDRRFFDFASFLFARQEQFMNDVFRHKTLEDQRQLAADMAQEFAGILRDRLLTLLDDSQVYENARTPIRYAATRSVWATPTIFINNADDLSLKFHTPLKDWVEYIDSLM